MNELSLKIAIAEPAVIIRSGLAATLKRIQGIHIQAFETSSNGLLNNYIRIHKPDILIINPLYWGSIDTHKLKVESGHKALKCFALISYLTDDEVVKQFDDKISIYDSVEQLKAKLNRTFEVSNIEVEDAEILSLREKEILTCVVKGQTNKEIAQSLFLSTHTVISHRRNIVRKLEIHSTAGLTIYAIVNKLVELDEIKNDI